MLERHVEVGHGPGAVAVLARHGEVHIEAAGTLAFEGAGSRTPMAADTVFRIASMTKPVIAACAMTLVEDRVLRLDDPVDTLLPELAGMTVLADPNGPLNDTVPADRPITLRDLLTCRLGTGTIIAEPGTVPIADALDALERGRSTGEPGPSPDEWIRRLGALPLVCQPGKRFIYNTGPLVTGVLIARATGKSLEDVVRERICEPLGMKDTGFRVGRENAGRLATAYEPDEATGELVVEDGPDGRWRRPPTFKAPASGLVSTPEEFLTFASALLHGERILSRPSVALMTSDHLTPEQKAVSSFTPERFFKEYGWGFGMSVRTRRARFGPSAGSYGWYGKYGSYWINDPAEDMTAVLILQRTEWERLPVYLGFLTAAYKAIAD
ncbi:beta-lactamase family protein [Streptomyces sp. NBC_00654]|uniref:serine hydrolase domain-containing protein n=1 Tax=Streptomyces sp. NBC_00654 TaxID=2975799 RepID=UPI002258BC5D|nr:serine hydrolase domain-containing protein [Streptomyces sp. NBC_00654]MCX4966421.1 beta-lactamase family protein [Streptomyces sp. NBC_00654]